MHIRASVSELNRDMQNKRSLETLDDAEVESSLNSYFDK